ncbi:MAG: thiamine pyrophosphate-dependent enzyme, partial [Sphingobium sp.]
ALNLAAVWKLPTIFLCQNNLYSEHTSFANCTGSENIAVRAAAYGMPGILVNGNDAVAMYRAAAEAVERARSGGGPTLIEARTFRFEGHILGDTSPYIPKEEMDAAIAADPVPALRRQIVAAGYATDEALDAMEDKIVADVAEALAYAIAEPLPDIAELGRDVLDVEIVP